MSRAISRFVLVLSVLLSICATVRPQTRDAAQGAGTWKTFELDQRVFSLSSPIELTLSNDGSGLTQQTYVGGGDGTLIVAKWFALPADSSKWSEKDQKNFFVGASEGVIESLRQIFKQAGIFSKPSSLERKLTTIDGCPAWNETFTMNVAIGTVVIIAAGNRGYIAALLAPPEKYDLISPRLFQSIRIAKKTSS